MRRWEKRERHRKAGQLVAYQCARKLLMCIHCFLATFNLLFAFLSILCTKIQEIDYSTQRNLENQLEWLQFSEIIVGHLNWPHHPITCRFFGPGKTSFGRMTQHYVTID